MQRVLVDEPRKIAHRRDAAEKRAFVAALQDMSRIQRIVGIRIRIIIEVFPDILRPQPIVMGCQVILAREVGKLFLDNQLCAVLGVVQEELADERPLVFAGKPAAKNRLGVDASSGQIHRRGKSAGISAVVDRGSEKRPQIVDCSVYVTVASKCIE